MSVSPEELIAAIDQLLPQTQCQQCQYPGCFPYATAIVKNHEAINRCIPGGLETLEKIAGLLGQDPQPMREEMQQKIKPRQLAVIREAECIGCTKCISACPVDAIIGASKQMHTVLADACTGCELCIEPCPVDCIDLIANDFKSHENSQQFADQSRLRYQKHQARLTHQHQLQDNKPKKKSLLARQSAIQSALARVQAKKHKVQL